MLCLNERFIYTTQYITYAYYILYTTYYILYTKTQTQFALTGEGNGVTTLPVVPDEKWFDFPTTGWRIKRESYLKLLVHSIQGMFDGVIVYCVVSCRFGFFILLVYTFPFIFYSNLFYIPIHYYMILPFLYGILVLVVILGLSITIATTQCWG